ncbi:MAG TPA: hypothetical protein VFV67_23480 [Actinophytocola sp.]|nr:hypothetical protein [Actinophytocola sp.]HEU5473620.1 hypothetical protein [Actinophytocola sp.]
MPVRATVCGTCRDIFKPATAGNLFGAAEMDIVAAANTPERPITG